MRLSVPAILINGFAAVLLVFAVADAARLLGRAHDPGRLPPADPGPAARAAAPARYEAIVAAHLYGVSDEEPGPQEIDAALTTLDLRLLGVVNSTDRAQARALIAVQEGPGRYFRVNQLIAGTDARVRAIVADQVVIERGGQLERVLLWSPENMARANQGAKPPPLPGVAAPAYPDLGAIADSPAAVLIPRLPGAAGDTP